MRTFLFALILFFNIVPLSAQVQNPVSWTYSVQKTKTQTWNVRITAKLEERWYIYSQNMDEGGPLPTKITFAQQKQVALRGNPEEVGELHTKFEEVFGMKTKYYEGKVVFEQEVIVKGRLPITVTGTIEYMVCNGEQCLPPTEEKFSVVVK